MAIINNQEIDNTDLVNALIQKYKENKKITDMQTAISYYAVENTEIQNKKREYADGRGSKKENTNVSNIKLANAYYRKSVKQKVNYAFGKPAIIRVESMDETQKNEEEEKLYQKEWNNLLNADNRITIKTLAENAINCGIGFVYVWIDENEKFNIIDTPSPELYPRWKDKSHKELQALVRNYATEIFEDDEFKEVKKAELWTSEEVSYFNNEDSLELISTEKHMDRESWGRIPFLWLKGSSDEKPLLNIVKSYVDAYDKLNSESVDTLRDDLDTIIVLKNYTSETGKLIDAYRNLKELKIGAVDSDGGISLLKNDPNITSIQDKLQHLKKEIEEFTSTVDIKEIQLGNNPSGIAIKSAFQDTDTYINDIEMEFELFVENLKYFFDKYLDWTGKVSKDVSSKYKVIVTLDRDMMINETELIENTSKLQGLVSQETLDNYNPAIESHEIEQARREAEAEKNASEEVPFDFPPPVQEETEEIENAE